MIKTLSFIIISTIIYMWPVIEVAADQASGEPKRWGIVTDKPLNNDDTSTDEQSQNRMNPSTTAPDTQTQTKPQDEEVKSASKQNQKNVDSDQLKSSGVKPPETSPGSTTSKTKKQVQTPKAIKWDSEVQKETCTAYMKQLQDLFLKTRHYSIQGVPCQTAENAEAFLQLSDKCNSECPAGLIERSGYTSRIMRNIQFLKKLGNDRCEDTQSVKKIVPKPTPDRIQTQKSN